MQPAVAWCWTALLVAMLGGEAARADPIRLEAGRLELRPRRGAQPARLHAEGDVKLELGDCRLQASELTLEANLITAEQVRLQAGGLDLEAPRLRLGPGASLSARWPRLSLCRCPGRRPLLRLGAAQALVSSTGRRLHLRWPALWIGSRRVLTIPYLLLPLRRGLSGLFLPEVSWSPRDGVRLEQAGYLAGRRSDLLLGAGWVEGRGATARLRGALLVDGRAEAELALRGQKDGDRLRGAVQGSSFIVGRGVNGGLLVDLVSDQGWLADLEREPDRVFSPYLRSRAFAGLSGGPLALAATVDLLQLTAAPLRGSESPGLGPARLSADLLPVPLAGPFFFGLRLELVEWGDAAAPAALPWQAQLSVSPRLGLASRLGPLRLSGLLGYRFLGGWLPGLASTASANQHSVLVTVDAGLPLARRFRAGTVQHRIEPFLGGLLGRSSTALLLPELSRQEGAFLAVGLRTSLLRRPALLAWRRLLRAELRLEIPLDEPAGALREELLLGGELELRPAPAVTMRGLWRGRLMSGETVEGRGEACLPGRGPVRVCGGYLHLRQLRAEELLAESALGWPLLDPAERLALQTVLDQVFASVELRLGPATAWARLAIDPAVERLTQGSYGLKLQLGCGCLHVEVAGISRAGQRWPDLLARLALTTWRDAPGCRP